ncbi:MAG: transcriptional regulator [Corynebacterium sp.]|uniref:helix-turn-helix transcriptional regulator n=1 Tax=Corynebacterium sp. TaxID=1720 RepID=UPI0026DC8905|nr:metalloregulator ArsR/SmtB family transcription factor [Corynebacterium sp.]MDO5097748.1 transcriptional regulator [Corynebacterium sp.]
MVGTQSESRSTDGETRRAIMLTMLRAGTITATQLGETLGLSPAGIRRHLDKLIEDGQAELLPIRKTSHGSRGRPAKAFRLTETGKKTFGHDYDSLAAQALATLRETGGDEAVRAFARKRAADIVADVEKLDDAPLEQVAEALVDAFSRNGYAATINNAGHGVQICQHHCPISQVAAEFPELCEAEHEAIAQLLGHHVQPLASIADGHGVCTTNIPLLPIHSPNERSDS